MIQGTCPDGRHLQALLEEGGVRSEADELVHHLENCSDCQETLQDLAAPPDVWACTAQGLMNEARTEPALHRLVRRLKEEDPLLTEDDNLSFLRPTDKPGLLGLLDRYEVQEEIGRGGMGVVLKAVDPDLNRIVAIKVMSPWLASNATARRRFVREAKAAAAVCHDHIVTVHGVSEADGLPYLVMQYVVGESLQNRLDRAGPLAVEEVVRIGLQTATGLAAAHAQGLIHRDIKPANLLLENGSDRVKITDFGLARMADEVALTQDGAIAGTPEYMAPEQARGETVDYRADLFSLGSVLYAMCTGSPPFRGSTALAVLRQVNDAEPVSLRLLNADVPAWLEAFIARLMAKEPAQRFQSAAEVAALLEGDLTHLRQPAMVPVPELSPSAFTGRVKQLLPYVWLTALVGLTVLGLSLFFLAQIVSPQQAPPVAEPALQQFYQDFRGGQSLHPSLQLEGPEDTGEASKFEAEGLRITLPATRPVNWPVEVVTSFALSGDFEVTGTYELLSAARPAKGYGVGVTLSIADTKARKKFAKVARTILPRKGSVFESNYWGKNPKGYQQRTKPTTSRIGQLRLVRKGPALRYLVADGLGGDFEELFSQDQFGTEDMAHVLLGVMDSGSPGNAVDARLVDFKIRAAKLILAPASASALNPAAAGQSPRQRGPKKWLIALALCGAIFLSFAALGWWFLARRNRRAAEEHNSAAAADSRLGKKVRGRGHERADDHKWMRRFFAPRRDRLSALPGKTEWRIRECPKNP